MILTNEIKIYLYSSVLCWLATASSNNVPNVSPKEVFTYFDDSNIIVANIASPQTVLNIKENNNVCISFIHVFKQKGYQLKGEAKIISKKDPCFEMMESKLVKITKGEYPFTTITNILVTEVKPIIAPKYVLFPETTEKEQIESAKQAYLQTIIS